MRTAFAILLLLCVALFRAAFGWTVPCEGTYGGHLQGVASDGTNLWWSFTVEVVKTDANGARLATTGVVATHHGDLCLVGDTIYVAVNLGQFNTENKANSWVYAYRADTLAFIQKWAVPELVHGAGGMTWHDGRFYVVGGLPATGHDHNYIYEYTPDFTFVQRHDLPGYTYKGIQTAHFWNGRFWFGIYGETGNPAGRLSCAADFTDLVRTTESGDVGIIDWDGALATGVTSTTTVDGTTRHVGKMQFGVQEKGEHIIGRSKGQYASETVAAGTRVEYYDLFPGGVSGSTGVLEVAGQLLVDRKLTIARQLGSVGRVHLAAGGSLRKDFIEDKPFYVGYAGNGELELDDRLDVATGDRFLVGYMEGSAGRTIVNVGGTLAGSDLRIGSSPRTTGVLELRGGTVEIPAGSSGYYPLQVGATNALDTGEVRGWGSFVRKGSGHIRVSQFGRIVADGGGVERDLDMGFFRTVGTGNSGAATTNFRNPTGTAGWYAVNKGRLILPHQQEVYVRDSQPITCTGDYCYTTNSFLNNSVMFSLKGTSSDKYMFAALYAPDRSDVPPLPSSRTPVAIWRLGYAKSAGTVDPQTPVTFESITLRFRHAPDNVPVHTHELVLLRWDGAAWRELARSTDWATPLQTPALAPYADAVLPGYNIGWFAVCARFDRGTVFLLR